ncbi:MAG: hypothetical protein KTV77_05495 [Wolbachia endosymbiont of Fragariocoptes setiger]|nr:hypothetical protein [Wolbachia endosymbiont of Fragariocoptes setiger]
MVLMRYLSDALLKSKEVPNEISKADLAESVAYYVNELIKDKNIKFSQSSLLSENIKNPVGEKNVNLMVTYDEFEILYRKIKEALDKYNKTTDNQEKRASIMEIYNYIGELFYEKINKNERVSASIINEINSTFGSENKIVSTLQDFRNIIVHGQSLVDLPMGEKVVQRLEGEVLKPLKEFCAINLRELGQANETTLGQNRVKGLNEIIQQDKVPTKERFYGIIEKVLGI